MAGAGYGITVKGGQLPAGSDHTAYQVIGCTNKAGLSRTNHEAAMTIPGLGTLSGLNTHVWTSRHKGVVAAHSVHRIAQVSIGGNAAGSVAINGLVSKSTALHSRSGFHAKTRTRVASITFTPPGGAAQPLAVPTRHHPIVVPGLVRISLGNSNREQTRDYARARADVLKIKVIPTLTTAKVGHSRAQISGGVKSGLFSGRSFATRAKALDDNLTSGPTPLLIMLCQGTRGAIQHADVARLNLGDKLVIRGLATEQRAKQTATRATGYERARVARVNLGHGHLVVSAITAKAAVTRTGKKVAKNAPTSIGRILLNGKERHIPKSGILEIPGLARLESRIVHRSPNSIYVTALRLTLLDGTGAVIDLGNAKFGIRASGL